MFSMTVVCIMVDLFVVQFEHSFSLVWLSFLIVLSMHHVLWNDEQQVNEQVFDLIEIFLL